MEVIPLIRNSATGSEASKGDNGIKRHVQEWSRLDRLTGILEHARVEADQWTNHTANTKHKYGKVVDRRARNLADGSKEETQQTKQLEVFQAHTAGCSVQVIRSQTSTTSSWHNSSAGSNAFQWPSSIFDKKDNQFDQLRLEHSPLDVSSQKSKATVGRSGSISTRRPPTRRPQAVTSQLPKIESIDSTDTMETSSSLNENVEESVSTNLNRLKSCSNDEIRSDINESEEPLDRSSRFRRSLQFAQSKNIESNHKVAGELENVLKKVLGKKLQAVDGDIVDEYSLIKPASPLKKPTFITVECLKKTKNNLRHLNEDKDKEDDGIETDVKPTGDSRSLDYRGSALTRTEEWYNRRKSYGFEKVTTSDHNGKYATDPSAMDSSTDSGICRSTENGLSNSSRQSSVDRESIADLVKKYSNKEINNNTQVHAYNTTVVAKGKILEAINSLRSKSSAYFDVVKPSDTISESTENDESEKEQVYMRRLSVGMDMAMDKNVNRDEVPKRHSIAVVSEVADKEPGIDKKNGNKKVEFCRTEVHFDATPGKINIVDMEDKPAPAQLYRPKKRYNRPPEKSSHGLPEYRFGDVVHSDVVLQINGTGNQNGGNSGNECPTTEDETTDNGSSMPKSILKRQQLQHQQQSQHQQQQQNASDNSGGVASDNGIEVRISSTESTPVDCRRASWSVADRVKQVEAVGFSTRVNFTEGETTAVGFDPADPRKQRYSYNGSASPVWYQNNGNSPSATADNRLKKTDVKTYESTLVVPNVTSVLLNHEKQLEPERSQFQPVSVHTSQVTHVVKHQFDDSLQKQPSKRVPVKIVQDNRKCKPKTDAPVTKMCATVSLKQVPMTVQPKPVQCNENKKKPAEKKESIYGNIGYRANSLRVKDKPTTNKQAQDLFSTGRDSWLNMPKDLGPKLNKSKATTYKSRVNRKETVDSEVSVLEELNRAADEILKAVNGYTDDESQLPNDAVDNKTKTNLDHSEAKLKNKKKAARLLQRANSREALLHLDEVSSSDEDAVDEIQRIKPKIQRKTKTQSQTTTNSVATKTTASFTKKIQSRTQNVTKTNVQHKVHPTYYGNVSSCTQAPMKFRNKPSESLTKRESYCLVNALLCH